MDSSGILDDDVAEVALAISALSAEIALPAAGGPLSEVAHFCVEKIGIDERKG